MIELTRLNGTPLFLNSELIKWAESAPDTMLTLINGEKVVVRESCAEVVQRMAAQRIRLLTEVVGLEPTMELLARGAAGAAAGGQRSERRGAESHRGDFRECEPEADSGLEQK